jgi:hypothetical protein
VQHLAERWITYRLRHAIGDLFLGRYLPGPSSAILLAEILAQTQERPAAWLRAAGDVLGATQRLY